MKKVNLVKRVSSLLMIGAFVLAAGSCEEKEGVKTFEVKVQLEYPDGYTAQKGVKVELKGAAATFEASTDSTGLAAFKVTAGTYEARVSEVRNTNASTIVLNGTQAGIAVTDPWSGEIVTLTLSESKQSKLLIKELYVGGCQKDDGGSFQRDPYVILYNNSSEPISLKNVSWGATLPSNGHTTNNFVNESGVLSYQSEGWIPAGFAIWTLEQDVTLDAGKQIVIAFENAIDNTQTYSNSINFAHPEYYAGYDMDVYTNTTYYKVSDVIPTNHYLKAYKLTGVTANAFVLSVSSPALFIFQPTEEGDSIISKFVNNPENITLHGVSTSQATLKTPVEWILDGIEVFAQGQEKSTKRLTDKVDAGSIYFTNQQGYTLYRNVDKEATEAIANNAGKLVYNYSLGTADLVGGSTDPSGIDAEASIKNGATIIYKDTNNSSVDFHQRRRASLRD